MLVKSGEANGIYIEWHQFDVDGKPLLAAFSEPDDPMWEFWCERRKLTLFAGDGPGSVTIGKGIDRGVTFTDVTEQEHILGAFKWLLSGL